jgi:hypothetical protein
MTVEFESSGDSGVLTGDSTVGPTAELKAALLTGMVLGASKLSSEKQCAAGRRQALRAGYLEERNCDLMQKEACLWAEGTK